MDLDLWANWSDIMGIPIAIIGLLLVLHQLYLTRVESEKEHLRMKNEMTLNAYSTVRKDLRIITAKIRKELDIKDMFDNLNQERLDRIMKDKALRHDVSEMLGMLNKFAVGVKHDIFNIDILNELSGKYFIKTHKQFTPYLERVREDSDTLYIEYDNLVKRLKEMHGYKREEEVLSFIPIEESILYLSPKTDRWLLAFGAMIITETYLSNIEYIPTLFDKFIIVFLVTIILWISIQLIYAVKKYLQLINRRETI